MSNNHNFDIRSSLKEAISLAVTNSDLSVAQITAKIYEISKGTIEVTPSIIYNWTAVSHIKHMPKVHEISALCEATRCFEPIKVILSPFDMQDILGIMDDFKTMKKELGK
jgi:hypothetical protein